jgi:hypothetical protein
VVAVKLPAEVYPAGAIESPVHQIDEQTGGDRWKWGYFLTHVSVILRAWLPVPETLSTVIDLLSGEIVPLYVPNVWPFILRIAVTW